jgi:TetR/AcrR family transcriptional regulator, regulator of autoinduction and epiphytic fitness
MVTHAPASPTAVPVKKPSFREKMHQAREDAIVQAVNRLLAEKGFDAMTVDEVAAEVGVAKASLYKHFPSKEHLAAAAMVRVLQRTLAHMATLPAEMAAHDKLKSVVRWAMAVHLAGEMPLLPTENSTLRATLMGHGVYLDALVQVSDALGAWIEQAQAQGALNPATPPIVVLYTLFARACDPVLGFMKAAGQHTNEEIVALVLTTCFDGLNAR